MLLIDFEVPPKKAFYNGLLKGLSAPFLLYGSFTTPTPPNVDPVVYETRSDLDAIRSDWDRVGKDISEAIAKYGEEQQAA